MFILGNISIRVRDREDTEVISPYGRSYDGYNIIFAAGQFNREMGYVRLTECSRRRASYIRHITVVKL